MLMSESRQVMMQVRMMAGMGMPQLGGTCSRWREKGTPWSRAKDQSWREAVATCPMQADMKTTMMTLIMTEVPALLCVAL